MESDGVHEFILPPKRSPDGSLQKRLTSIAYDHILPTYYLQRGSDGELLETQEALFDRVARNISLAESVAKEGYEHEVAVSPADLRLGRIGNDDIKHRLFGEDVSKNDVCHVDVNERTVSAFSDEVLRSQLPKEILTQVDTVREEFYSVLSTLSFVPNSPVFSNAGTRSQQLASCFALSAGDDFESVMQTLDDAAKIMKSGGGVGYSLGNVPLSRATTVGHGEPSFPLRVLMLLDQIPESVLQGGTRRGAQIGVLPVHHPGIIEFIHAKEPEWSLAWTLGIDAANNVIPRDNSKSDTLNQPSETSIPAHLRNVVDGFLSNFNISVGITDRFMNAVEEKQAYQMRDPQTNEEFISTDTTKNIYERYGLGDLITVGEPLQIPAERLWGHIISAAYRSGEPGVLFLDQIRDDHSIQQRSDNWSRINTTDPCGVQPLTEYESCPLGHVNVATVVDNDAPRWSTFDGDNQSGIDQTDRVSRFLSEAIDWEKLNYRIDIGTRFLDDVVTMSIAPLKTIEQRTHSLRKVGVGLMGIAHLLMQLGIEYGSAAGNEVSRQITAHLTRRSTLASHKLAKERGCFPLWGDSKYADPESYPDWFQQHTGLDPSDWADGYPVRNHKTTSIAPCGTTSIVGGTTGGCEPVYEAFYSRKSGVEQPQVAEIVDEYVQFVLNRNDISIEPIKREVKRQRRLGEYEGIRSLQKIPDELADVLVTAHNIDPIEHARVQCACQDGIDAAISKTCNLSENATLDDVANIFRYVYENDGKGVTVYRNGSRHHEVLSYGSEPD